MLVAAAVCPHPPLLVPGVGAGASGELDPLRRRCREAVRALVEAEPDLVVAVGTAPRTGPYEPGARGDLDGFGASLVVGSGDGPPTLPLSLTVGEWLLDEADVRARRLHFGVDPDLPAPRAAALGAGLADRGARVALLVLGDGSARRSLKGPGYLDSAAEPFDDAVGAALARADFGGLLGLDRAEAGRLLVGGVAPWQVLAGAADGGSYEGQLLHHDAPYGVAYFVVRWRRTGDAEARG